MVTLHCKQQQQYLQDAGHGGDTGAVGADPGLDAPSARPIHHQELGPDI